MSVEKPFFEDFEPFTLVEPPFARAAITLELQNIWPQIHTGASILRESGEKHAITYIDHSCPNSIGDATLDAGKALAELAQGFNEIALLRSRYQFHHIGDFTPKTLLRLSLAHQKKQTYDQDIQEMSSTISIVDLTVPHQVVLGGVDLTRRRVFRYLHPGLIV